MTRVIAGMVGGRRLSVPAGRDTRPTSDRAREGLFATVQAVYGPLTGVSVLDLYAGSGAVGLEALSRGAARAVMVEAGPRAVRVIRANVAALGLPGAYIIAGRVEPVLAKGPAAAMEQAVPGRGAAGLSQTPPPGRAAAGLSQTPTPGRGAAGLSQTPPPGRAAAGQGQTPRPGRGAAGQGQSPGPGRGAAGRGQSPAPGAPEAVAGERFDIVFADPPYAMAGDAVTAMLTALVRGAWLAPGALVAVERSTRSGPLHWPDGYTEDRSRRYGEATLWYGHASGAAG